MLPRSVGLRPSERPESDDGDGSSLGSSRSVWRSCWCTFTSAVLNQEGLYVIKSQLSQFRFLGIFDIDFYDFWKTHEECDGVIHRPRTGVIVRQPRGVQH